MSLSNYEKQKVLGRGAFGTVCSVIRKKDGKIYAMKQINIANSSESEIEAALNEIRLLSSLNHINVIRYKEAFYDKPSNTLNIVMEYANGGDLAKRIEFNKKHYSLFNENFIWELIYQLLYGVVYLHSHHIIHRDLKTANIFIMKNNILKIGDLNVSKLALKGYARTLTGTPIYLAPEVWDNQAYDYKCDIWSLGCIIYELCTLYPPFSGNNYTEIRNNIKSGKYNPISSSYSNDLKQIIEWMLVVNPNKRKSSLELLNSDIIQRRINLRNHLKESFNAIKEEFTNSPIKIKKPKSPQKKPNKRKSSSRPKNNPSNLINLNNINDNMNNCEPNIKIKKKPSQGKNKIHNIPFRKDNLKVKNMNNIKNIKNIDMRPLPLNNNWNNNQNMQINKKNNVFRRRANSARKKNQI